MIAYYCNLQPTTRNHTSVWEEPKWRGPVMDCLSSKTAQPRSVFVRSVSEECCFCGDAQNRGTCLECVWNTCVNPNNLMTDCWTARQRPYREILKPQSPRQVPPRGRRSGALMKSTLMNGIHLDDKLMRGTYTPSHFICRDLAVFMRCSDVVLIYITLRLYVLFYFLFLSQASLAFLRTFPATAVAN